METKQCNKCKLEKHKTNDFPKNGRIYRAICKACHSEKQKERYFNDHSNNLEKKRTFYHENKENLIEINKQYRSQHKEEICEQKKIYYKENRDEILRKCKTKDYKEKRNKVLKEKRKNDKTFALISAYRARLKEVLHKQKKNTYISYLNCKRDNFLSWIEFQFKGNFIWETYSKEWVIDHVIPINFFDLNDEEHVFMCFSWFNLRPCKKNENLQKSDKIILEIIEDHQNTLNNFIKISNWYQTHIEIYGWLREKLRYGKNPSVIGQFAAKLPNS